MSSRIAGVGSDIYGIYYVGRRSIQPLPESQLIQFSKLSASRFDLSSEAKRLLSDDPGFEVTDRGERYGGPTKAWRRVIVRAANDPRIRTMSEAENLPVFRDYPAILSAVKSVVPLSGLDAVMLTRVSPDGGVIVRHTDIALDKLHNRTRFGLSPDRTIRPHFVIQGNPECTFSVWDLQGVKKTVTMASGEVWYADVRKPHEVTNGGHVTRLHLCVDCNWSEDLWHRLRSEA